MVHPLFLDTIAKIYSNILCRTLADTQNCHTLDSTDFAIGMHLIKAVMSDQLSSIPTSLPPGLYEQASGNGIGSNESAKSGSTSLPHQNAGPGALQHTAQNQAVSVTSSTSCTVPDQVLNSPSTLCQRCPDLQIQLNSINGALDAVKAERELLKQALDALTLRNQPLRTEVTRITEHDEKWSGVMQPSGNHKSASYRPSAKSSHVNAVAGPSRPTLDKIWPKPEKVQAKPEVDSSHGSTPKRIYSDPMLAEQKRRGEYLSKQNYPDFSPPHRNHGPLTPTRSDSTCVSQKQQGDLSQNNQRNAIYQTFAPTLPAHIIQPSRNHKSASYPPSAKSAHVNAVAGPSRPSQSNPWTIPAKVQAKPEVYSSCGSTRHLPKQIYSDPMLAEQKQRGEYLSKQNYLDFSPHHRNRESLTPTRSNSTRVSQKQQGDLSQIIHRNAIYQIFTPTLQAQKKREDLTRNIPSGSMFECGICMEEKPEDCVTPLDSCGHKFCRDCIKDYIGVKLAEHCFPILCPVCMANKAQGGACHGSA